MSRPARHSGNALDIRATLEPVRQRWSDLEVPLEVGIGINSGPMIIGEGGHGSAPTR
jgi:class 3 adenylate cyclase